LSERVVSAISLITKATLVTCDRADNRVTVKWSVTFVT